MYFAYEYYVLIVEILENKGKLKEKASKSGKKWNKISFRTKQKLSQLRIVGWWQGYLKERTLVEPISEYLTDTSH